MMKLCVLLLLAIVLAQAANHVSAYRKHKCSVKDIQDAKNVIKNVGNCTTEQGKNAFRTLKQCGENGQELRLLCSKSLNAKAPQPKSGGVKQNATGSKSKTINGDPRLPKSQGKPVPTHPSECVQNVKAVSLETKSKVGIQCPAAKITGLLNSLKKPGRCSSEVGRAAVKSLLTCGKSQADLQNLCGPKFHFDFSGNQKGSGSGIPCTTAKITGLRNSLKKPGGCSSKVGHAAVKSLLTCGKSQADLQKHCGPKFDFDFGGNRKGSGSYLQKLCGPNFHFEFGGSQKGSGSKPECKTDSVAKLLKSIQKPGSCSTKEGKEALQTLFNCGKSQAEITKICSENSPMEMALPAPCPAAKIDSLMNKMKKLNDCSSAEGKAVRQELINCGKSQEELNSLCHNFWKGVGNFIRNPFGIFGK